MYLIPYSDLDNKAQAHLHMDCAKIGPFMPILAHFFYELCWASHAHFGPLKWTLDLFKGFTTCLIRLESFPTYVGFIIPC